MLECVRGQEVQEFKEFKELGETLHAFDSLVRSGKVRYIAASNYEAPRLREAIATIALSWLAAQPTVLAPIASARVPEQLPPLLRATELHLTKEELAKLSEASA